MENLKNTYSFSIRSTLLEVVNTLKPNLNDGRIFQITFKRKQIFFQVARAPKRGKHYSKNTDCRIDMMSFPKDMELKYFCRNLIMKLKEGFEIVALKNETENIVVVLQKEKVKSEKILSELPYSIYTSKINQIKQKYNKMGYTIEQVYASGEYDVIEFRLKES